MRLNRTLTGSIFGTSAMTMFSYFLSGKSKKQFKEPVLLNKLLSDLYFIRYLKKNSVPGWLLHYFVGTIFATFSHVLWKTSKVNPTIQSGLYLGLMYGLIGITGWHLIFKLYPNPPAINLQEYYLHLLAAHLIFGCGTALGYKQRNDRHTLHDKL